MDTKKSEERKELAHSSQQTVHGQVVLADVTSALSLKVAVARDCQVLAARSYPVEAGQKELEFTLDFEHEHKKPIGVRLLVGPDVPDAQLRSADHQQHWVPAKEFRKGTAKVTLEASKRLCRAWRLFCTTYTLRGRVICRRRVWNRLEQRFVVCDAPVQGARVTAYDVDRVWWWYRRDAVGSDVTDVHGHFEIRFRWCCWWWRPWILERWRVDPGLVERLRNMLQRLPSPLPIPRPDPVPDFGIFAQMVAASDPATLEAGSPVSEDSFAELGKRLVQVLPHSPDLADLRVWPWGYRFHCRPDIVFEATQDCGEGEHLVYKERPSETRWNVDTTLDGIVLVANDDACCGPFCCSDPPDEDCLVFHEVGCRPVDLIEQDLSAPCAGYYVGTAGENLDQPFGRHLHIRGVFGDASEIDFYKVQRRQIEPVATGWEDLTEDEVGTFYRIYEPQTTEGYRERVKLAEVDGEWVLKTSSRYRQEHDASYDPDFAASLPSRFDVLAVWKTATVALNGEETSHLSDGLYELRVVGYRYDEDEDKLVDAKVMAICPPGGEDVDPAQTSTLLLRLDNRTRTADPYAYHLATVEPDCSFPEVCAVVKNEGQADQACVQPCGFLRLKAGDTVTVHFGASDPDGHLGGYWLTAHWPDGKVFNMITAGSLSGDPDVLVGPRYDNTFQGDQLDHRAGLPVTDPEHDRPFWYGGRFKVTVTVGEPAGSHSVFETCCAFLLRLRVWKRTSHGCINPKYFHYNRCDFNFTVIREDLIGDREHPSCTELCEEDRKDRG